MQITRATYEDNGKEIEMRRVEIEGAGFTIAVRVGGHREVYHEMGLNDAADLGAAASVATLIYGTNRSGRPACTNSEIFYLRAMMREIAGC